MRKDALFLCTITFFFSLAATLSSTYEEIMQSNIDKLFKAEGMDSLLPIANTFDRIAHKEVDQWQPLYYASYAHLMMSNFVEGQELKDGQLDQALERVTAAKKIDADNSEIITLEGFIHMLRIPIDPSSRGPQYSGLGMAAFQRAIAINPENPRAHLLMSDMQFGTAQFFGSDSSEACGTLHKAVELFATFTPSTKLDPDWGKEWAEQRLQRCE